MEESLIIMIITELQLFNNNLKISNQINKSNNDSLNLFITPSYRFYDGRSSNNSWLQELPDLLTTAVWDSWVEINSKLAEKLDIKEGDFVELSANNRKIGNTGISNTSN